jgi:ribosome-binding factor A
MKSTPRTERVGDEVRSAIANALLTEAGDERLLQVSITLVTMSPDLRHARVYWNVIATEPPSDRERTRFERALQRAQGFLRKAVADRVLIRHVPELTFVYDVSIEHARHMESVLSNLEIPDPQVVEDE